MSPSLRLTSAEDAADAGTFLHRVTRLDPDARVRLRTGSGGVELWAWLPLEVLVSRRVDGAIADVEGVAGEFDVTVRAADLLIELATAADAPEHHVRLPAADQAAFFGALPPHGGWHRIDRVPAGDVARLVRAGADTFRTAAATAPNANRVGAALLDHEALVVSDDTDAVRVPLRVPQALARMGFVPPGTQPGSQLPGSVVVSVTPAWARFDAAYGVAYLRRTPALSLIPL